MERQKIVERLGNMPDLRQFLLCCFRYSMRQNCAPRRRPTKAPTPRFSFVEVYGCHLPRRMGTNRLKRADTGLLVFRSWLKMKSTAIVRENPAEKILTASYFSETFWELCSLDGDRFFDYCGADFPFVTFQNLNFSRVFSFSRKGLFLVVIRLVDLFPPQILEGLPSARWWAEISVQKTFKNPLPIFGKVWHTIH